ncbi:acetyltransferase [Corallococcus coralloides DSM 2259]|uniref:Acetyltransferase n=1 Tax=Corallococcus coralloides (strain ATCC 25202 / DSM 2259 / NBRC 100086 / M2) TaxID=1144275 RepID=H8MYQ7_CORCM|nr:GNAT family N-acetyltransferase [Corallococcus coralloides]AFE08648.1 acetyltransferase [Corallococcus coralloides DSM 2259]
MAPSSLDWQWKRFNELTLEELYRLLALRSEVFVVEQKSIYLDADGLDAACFHLLGGVPGTGQLGAYLRALPPGLKFPEASLGRVVTAPALRGQRQGRDLVERGLHFLSERFPGAPVRIGAQAYLQRFYEGFGFVAVSDIYDEDGIPHLDMRRG